MRTVQNSSSIQNIYNEWSHSRGSTSISYSKMTVDETTNRKVQTYNTYDTWHVDEMYEKTRSPLSNSRSRSSKFFQHISPHWVPGQMEDEDDDPPRGMRGRRNRTSQNENNEDDPLLDSNGGNKTRQFSTERHRGFRRRFFLFLTEPDTSLGSAAFFFVLIFAISISNFIMIMQTMDSFQYTPTDCHICGGKTTYLFDDDLGNISAQSPRVCQCPPEPYPYLEQTVDYLLYFFAVEWTLRVLFFADAHPSPTVWGQFGQWLNFLTSSSTLIDALAIWPYFFESLPKGLVSLRLLRLFRVFQLVRLGQYNTMFLSLTNVLQKSLAYLRLLVLVLLFGAAFFGSMLFWLEQGTWKYWEPTGDFQYVRMSVDGVNEEISPFRSIPVSFWWFLVTATTVGYGGMCEKNSTQHNAMALPSSPLIISLPHRLLSN